jgi:hypothetical protein
MSKLLGCLVCVAFEKSGQRAELEYHSEHTYSRCNVATSSKSGAVWLYSTLTGISLQYFSLVQ